MTDLRHDIVVLARNIVADEQQNGTWTYEAVRPMPMPMRPWRPGQKVRGDCSKGCQFLNWWIDGPDPMGTNFGPYGNSQTLWLKLQHLDRALELLPGDFVTFGIDGDEHTAMVLEPGADPLLWSFGHQGAPNTYRLSQDGRPAQFLRNPLPTYVPTPADRLRARTGWFAWVAWRLGEGDWRSHQPADKSVRPNVPARIPLGWWRRYAQFVLARKKPNKPTTAA